MPKYGLYLHGERSSHTKIFGWTGAELNNQVYLVSGPYKMMSLFMRTLLTPKNSIIGRPEEGTDFLDLVSQGFGDSALLQDALVEVLEDAFQQVQTFQASSAQSGHIEDDELLVAYALTDFFVSSDAEASSARVELTNAAGDTVPGLIPLAGYAL